MKKCKVLKHVFNGTGIDPSENSREGNVVAYELFFKKGIGRWSFTMSGGLEGVAESLALVFLETKKDRLGRYDPFMLSDMDLSFSSEGVRRKGSYGYFVSDLRELSTDERDQFLVYLGREIRKTLEVKIKSEK